MVAMLTAAEDAEDEQRGHAEAYRVGPRQRGGRSTWRSPLADEGGDVVVPEAGAGGQGHVFVLRKQSGGQVDHTGPSVTVRQARPRATRFDPRPADTLRESAYSGDVVSAAPASGAGR